MRANVQAFVKSEAGLRWAQVPPGPREAKAEHWAHLARAGLVGLGAVLCLPLLLPLVLVALPVLLVKELTDPVQEEARSAAQVNEVEYDEDQPRVAQNHLASVIPVKPGILRAAHLPVVLYIVNLYVRVKATKGDLGGIPSIHFAHWSLIDHGRHLLFVSNYDGSWESYLGDFVDKAAVGLTAVWSNTRNFPRTTLLAFKGAADGPPIPAVGSGQPVPHERLVHRLPDCLDDHRRQLQRHPRGLVRRPRSGEDDRVAAMPVNPTPTPTATGLELEDMQGLVARAYGHLPSARYLLCRFGEPAAARAWLGQLAGEVFTADRSKEDVVTLNVALTLPGLRRLGLAQDALATLPRPLQEGMVTPHRSRTLGDVGERDPSRWRWGGSAGQAEGGPPAGHALCPHRGGVGRGPRQSARCVPVGWRRVGDHRSHRRPGDGWP